MSIFMKQLSSLEKIRKGDFTVVVNRSLNGLDGAVAISV